jgi:radical SAM protein with 4Fe4S-binding SPASM domain
MGERGDDIGNGGEMTGLSVVNLELTSKCDKACWICWHKHVKEKGDMDFSLLERIAAQLPSGLLIQFHINGEPLLYPRLKDALDLFQNHVRCFDTNGKLLVKKADEIIDNMECLTISVFQGDTEVEEQQDIVREFLRIKKNRKPRVAVRCSGDIDTKPYRWMGLIVKRPLHSPDGKYDYPKKNTIPEHGICLDALSHLAISYNGDVRMCVNFDKNREGVIGNARSDHLWDIWSRGKRIERLTKHIQGRRNEIPLCRDCEYWGIP